MFPPPSIISPEDHRPTLLHSLDAETLRQFFNKLSRNGADRKKLSPKRIRSIYNLTHAALEQAVINRKLNFYLIIGMKLPKAEHKEMRVLTPEEQKELQKAVFDIDVLPSLCHLCIGLWNSLAPPFVIINKKFAKPIF